MKKDLFIRGLDSEIIEALDKLALKEDRSRSYIIRKVLAEKVKKKRVVKKVNGKTPAQIAEEFFNTEAMHTLASQKFNLPLQTVQEFVLYWTELSKDGKKQRWQMQKTFDVKRRLFRWASNSKEFKNTSQTTAIL